MKFKFADNRKVEALDKVPREFHGMYEQGEDGGFVLSSSMESVANSIDGLNNALGKERGSKVDLSPLAAYGDTPAAIAESVNAKIGELEDQIKEASKGKVNIDKVRQDLKAAHQVELDKEKARADGYRGQLDTVLVDNRGVTAITREEGNALLLMPHVRSQVKTTEVTREDGRKAFEVEVIDKDGDRRYSPATGQPMTIDELVVEMKGKPEFAACFKSQAPSGGGARPAARRTPSGPGKEQKSANEKIAAGISSGQRRYGAAQDGPQGVTGDQ